MSMQRNTELERVAEVFVGDWTLMHQRILARAEGNRMIGQTDASDDQGATWRKDFDLVFERAR